MNGQPVVVKIGEEATEATNVEPVAIATAVYDTTEDEEKVGGKCCGCCCDFRRAVIITDALLILGSCITMFSYLFVDANDSFEYRDVDDDRVLDKLNEQQAPLAVIFGLGMICYAVPLYGAITYNIPMIFGGIAWSIITFVAGNAVTYLNFEEAEDLAKEGESMDVPYPSIGADLILLLLLVYAHAMLIREIRTGIMSEKTYPREKYSCCCTV